MKRSLLLFGLFILAGVALAQYPQHAPTLIPEWVKNQKGWIIYSDFGPRNLKGLGFHDGIDYANNAGKTIYPVEPGNISQVTLSKGPKSNGNLVVVKSTGDRYWWYKHMFVNEGYENEYSHILEENWEISRSDDYPITLVNPADTTKTYSLRPEYFEGLILRINDNDNHFIDYVLFKGDYDGWWIKNMLGEYVVNPDENKVLVKGIIETNSNTVCYPPVGPVGNTGWSTGYHLHLSLTKDNVGAKPRWLNPFYYVAHGAPSQPLNDPKVMVIENSLEFLKKDGRPYEIPHFNQIDWVHFKASINSKSGIDLNSVNFYIVDKNNMEILLTKDNNNKTFSFGGREDYNWGDRYNTDIYEFNANKVTTGVKQGDNGCGLETFVYAQSMLVANNGNALAPGKYKLKVVAEDVNGNLSSNQPTTDFEVGKWQNVDLSTRPHKSSTDKYTIEGDDAGEKVTYKMSPSYYSSTDEEPICFEVETKDSIKNISSNVVGVLNNNANNDQIQMTLLPDPNHIGQDGFYWVKSNRKLAPGEYALILKANKDWFNGDEDTVNISVTEDAAAPAYGYEIHANVYYTNALNEEKPLPPGTRVAVAQYFQHPYYERTLYDVFAQWQLPSAVIGWKWVEQIQGYGVVSGSDGYVNIPINLEGKYSDISSPYIRIIAFSMSYDQEFTATGRIKGYVIEKKQVPGSLLDYFKCLSGLQQFSESAAGSKIFLPGGGRVVIEHNANLPIEVEGWATTNGQVDPCEDDFSQVPLHFINENTSLDILSAITTHESSPARC